MAMKTGTKGWVYSNRLDFQTHIYIINIANLQNIMNVRQSKWSNTGLINNVDMVCFSPVGFGV